MLDPQLSPETDQPAQSPPSNSATQAAPSSAPLVILLLIMLVVLLAGASLYLFFRVTQLEKQVQQVVTQEISSTRSPSATQEAPKQSPSSIPEGWLVYEEPLTKLSLAYPPTVTLNPAQADGTTTTLTVTAQPIAELEDLPLGFTKEVALKDQQSLLEGQYGEQLDFAVPESEKVFTFPGGNGKTYVVLSQLDVCDVKFMRKAIMYHNDIQVIIAYRGPQSLIQDSLGYYKIDEANCGSAKMWKPSNLFYSRLLTKQHTQPVQEWYETFDTMLSTLHFTE